MAYNRQTAINAIARLKERQSQKKDVEFKSFKEKKREEKERKIKENKINKKRTVLVELCLNIQKPKDIKILEYQVKSVSDMDARISVNTHIFREFGTFPVSTKILNPTDK